MMIVALQNCDVVEPMLVSVTFAVKPVAHWAVMMTDAWQSGAGTGAIGAASAGDSCGEGVETSGAETSGVATGAAVLGAATATAPARPSSAAAAYPTSRRVRTKDRKIAMAAC